MIDRYLPVLMHQAKVLWDRADYRELEKLLGRTMDFYSDNETWKLNVAHVLFMQGDKYNDAIGFYEPIVKNNYNNVRTVLCLRQLCAADAIMFILGPMSADVSRQHSIFCFARTLNGCLRIISYHLSVIKLTQLNSTNHPKRKEWFTRGKKL